MHEFSIALNVVQSTEEEAIKVDGVITEVVLEIGKLSGVVKEALEFALDEAKKRTRLSGAIIKYIEIPGSAKCNNCGNTYDTDDHFSICPECNHPYCSFIRGKEMRIKSIKVETENSIKV